MGDVIDFPKRDSEKRVSPNIEMTHILIQNVLDTLIDYGYDVNSPRMKKDIAILVNVIHAILERHDGNLTFLDRFLDELGEFYHGDS